MGHHVTQPPVEIATDALLAFLDTGATPLGAVQNFNAHKDALIAAQGWDALPDVQWYGYDVTLGNVYSHSTVTGGVWFEALEPNNDATQVQDLVVCSVGLLLPSDVFNAGQAATGIALRRYVDCLRTMLGRGFPIGSPTRRDASGRTLNNGGTAWPARVQNTTLGRTEQIVEPDSGATVGVVLPVTVQVEVT